MKTLIIYNDIESELEFLIVDGDLSRFHNVVLNSFNETEYEKEFTDWMFNPETGDRNHDGWSKDVSLVENKQWDKVAICTFLP